MDSLDAKILRALTGGLFGGPFVPTAQSLRSIARKIGADKETVRNHMLSLERKGIILGWRAMINPEIIAMEATRVWGEFPSEQEKERVIEKLSRIQSVRVIYDYFGRGISFVMAVPSGKRSSTETLETLGLKDLFVARISFPKTSARLTESDWRIYNSIRDNPYKGQNLVSRETGFATRTLKRRLARLAKDYAILIFPVLQPGKLDGVVCDMLVKHSNPAEITEAILAEAGDSAVRVEHYGNQCVLFSLVVPNIKMTRTLLKKVRSMTGVTNAQIFIVQEMIQPKTRLDIADWKKRSALTGKPSNGIPPRSLALS